MRRRTPVPLAAALVLSILATASVADDVVPLDRAAGAATGPKPGDAVSPRSVTPLVAELLRLAEAERPAVAALRSAIAQTHDPVRQLELQRRIEAVKRDTQRALLRTQIEYANREGRTQVASELEAALLLLDNPPAVSVAPVAPAQNRK